MMDDDDLTPQHVAPKSEPRKLDAMSIEHLHDYVAELEAEIDRAKAMIAGKEAARSSADSVFRS